MSSTGYKVQYTKIIKTKSGSKLLCPYCDYLHDVDVVKHGDSIFCHVCNKVSVVPDED